MTTHPPTRLANVTAAVEQLRRSGLVAFPTETVWGVAANATDATALARLRRFKGRAETRPVAILVTDVSALAALGAELSEAGRRLAQAFWPGPLTLILRCRAAFAPGVAGPGGAVGFRCSPHPVAAALARAARAAGLAPPTATSLNRSGAPPAAGRAAAERACANGPDAPALLDAPGPDAGGGPASSVVDLTGAEPRVLREGALDRARLATAWQSRGGA